MAIIHNLSVINDTLSGFDPVAGEVDGTTIGRNYLMWQVFKGLEAFDSNVVMISSSGATPSWLRTDSGSIMTEPAKSANTTFQTIRFFMANDYGLSAPTQSAYIHEWTTTSDATISNNNIFSIRILHRVSGSARYEPINSGSVVTNDNGATGAVTNCVLCVYYETGATTVMKNIPKIIYWRSDTSYAIMSISKYDATYRGYVMWHTPEFTGYRASLSSSFTQGENFDCIITNNANGGTTWMEPHTQNFETSLTAIGSFLSPLSSAGLMPTTQFVVSGSLTLLTGRIKFGVVNSTSFKAVSNYLEGVHLINNDAHPYAAGTLARFNNKYYIAAGSLSDGAISHKLMLQLED